jgi:hypothetical protein
MGNAAAPDSDSRRYLRLLPVVLTVLLFLLFRHFRPVALDLPPQRAFYGLPFRAVLGLGSWAAVAVSTWTTGVRMRRKIRRDLGRKATVAELTSLAIWVKVAKAEERNDR